MTSFDPSYTLQYGFDPFLRSAGNVTENRTLSQRFLLTSDLEDVVSARESLTRAVGLPKDLLA